MKSKIPDVKLTTREQVRDFRGTTILTTRKSNRAILKLPGATRVHVVPMALVKKMLYAHELKATFRGHWTMEYLIL